MKVTSRTERQAEGIRERILLEWMILYGNAYKVECMILYDNSMIIANGIVVVWDSQTVMTDE